jgi:hypothetical protein
MPRGTKLAKLQLRALGVIWLLCVFVGFRSLLNFATAPGESGAPPTVWPASSHLPRAPYGPTLVMTLHPRCSCSAATLKELAIFLQRAPQPLATFLLFHREGAALSSISSRELWKQAASLPNVTLLPDDGSEAAIFGANTSGQAMLYDAAGHLRFGGGITAARGHEGDNYGLQALLLASAASSATSPSPVSSPVFGCPLRDPSSAQLKKDTSWKKR